MKDEYLTSSVSAWLQRGRMLRYRGRDVYIRVSGSGPALMLIHGYPTGSYDWHSVWMALSQRHTLVAVDMLGLGLSDKPKDFDYSIAQHADLHEWLISSLRLKRLCLIAHDLGVSIAQEMLARRMQDLSLPPIDAVVMLNGGVFPEVYRPRFILRLLSSPMGSLIGPLMSRSAFERSMHPLFGEHAQPSTALLDDFWSLVTYRDGLLVTHLVGRFWKERLRLRNRLVTPLMQRSVPTRFINGISDPNSGQHMANRYAELVPDADVIRLEGVGHWPQLEQPERVAHLALEFLARYETR
ncbi:MAG: alpha/beta hydrolase [Hydrogenophaga sp.]|uniref:alpha/beta fold hydrolase n=1 Tax=Hydrogenophaga sp. TaxID=1904254 RepID=UPI002AB961E1|nr:alpha/beta hydrolase [Hydrogenophaga sp.]MDZ4173277.1 alpha/beta hydrolase [Hydrogenophaga sp.]